MLKERHSKFAVLGDLAQEHLKSSKPFEAGLWFIYLFFLSFIAEEFVSVTRESFKIISHEYFFVVSVKGLMKRYITTTETDICSLIM